MIPRKTKAHRFWRETRSFLLIGLTCFAFRSAVADWNDVPTGSMKPTILEGDRIFVNKLAYDLKVPFTTWHLAEWSQPERGEIVVFFSPVDNTRLVKRVVGLPGDVVELRQNQLFLNQQPVAYGPLQVPAMEEINAREPQVHLFAGESLGARSPHAVMATPARPGPHTFGPVTVPQGHYFMLGDNRDNSYDSRFYGCVERSRIVGRSNSVVLSLGKNLQPRWQRFFQNLP